MSYMLSILKCFFAQYALAMWFLSYNVNEERSLRAIALDYLGRREHARAELERKLAQKGHADDEIAAVLDRLQMQNLQSDQRFASSFLDQRARVGSGPKKIKMELEQHGVSAQIIDDVFAQASFDWAELANELWQHKFPQPAIDVKDKTRRQRFMLQRGFEYEHFKRLR